MMFHSLPLVVIGPALFILFLVAAYGGAQLSRRVPTTGEAYPSGLVIGAATSLLGLLIAFTFSIALGRYEIRRDLIVREANAVRNVVHRARMVASPAGEEIVTQTRGYLTMRIASEGADPPATLPPTSTVDLQEKLWATALSLPSNNGPLLDALTELFASADTRESARAEQIPALVLTLVVLMSVATSAILGFAMSATARIMRLPLLAYLAVLALALTLILDLDRPQVGGVRVSQGPLLQLLEQ
ncbi:MAG: hypothetical protein ABIO85_07855 [Sphingomicrobium sp.]